MKYVRQLFLFIKKWLWTIPTSKNKLKATDVLSEYVCIDYKGQLINLRKVEIPLWNGLSRKEKRAMSLKTKIQVQKGMIRFEKINGKMTCIKNKDYGK